MVDEPNQEHYTRKAIHHQPMEKYMAVCFAIIAFLVLLGSALQVINDMVQ